MKRYIGFICILYSLIFAYVVFFDKLKNFLAPQMQIYIKIAILPLFIIGLVMLFNNKIKYNFKISDLILLLPLILLILAGDARLTSSFARNRATNFNIEDTKKEVKVTKIEDEVIDNKKEDIKEVTKTYDFTKVDIEIVDGNYGELANYITFAPKAIRYLNNTIRLKGFSIGNMENLNDGYYAIGKYIISCCAADAEFGGFIVKTNETISKDKFYQIEGVLEKGIDKEGKDIMYVNAINIKEIQAEEQYVYPCYVYDGGLCKALEGYDLEY